MGLCPQIFPCYCTESQHIYPVWTMWHVYRWLKGPLNPYVSWSAMCYTKTLDKMHLWQTLWLRLCSAVNLKARVSKLYIDRGEESKIDSFSSSHLFWYSVNLLLCDCFHVTLLEDSNRRRGWLTRPVRGERDQYLTCCSCAPAFRKAKRLQPSGRRHAEEKQWSTGSCDVGLWRCQSLWFTDYCIWNI